MNVTEDSVVQHIKNKNERAIPFIIAQYGGLLTAIIKRHLNYQQQDCEECMDDVLLAIWNNIHCFNPDKNTFKQWIAAIAKYKAIDYQRRQITLQNKQFTVAEWDDAMLKADEPSDRGRVDELLEQLTDSERAIFVKILLGRHAFA